MFVLILTLLVIRLLLRKTGRWSRYDARGFDHNRIHRNGTKYDDNGYDYYGYDHEGYDRQGYNQTGRNRKGQYDRAFDQTSGPEEGFYDLLEYPVGLSDHARERFRERLGLCDPFEMEKYTYFAYRYGKSKRQIKKTSAYLVEELEQKHPGGVVLIYKGFVYVFSYDNTLKTLYKNERIPL